MPPRPAEAPPDLSGVWAGSWQGTDPSVGGLGLVSGTWETEITQGATSASGPVELLGDVDCMDGQMQTNPDATFGVTGALARPPCAQVGWSLTALNLTEGSASGGWSNAGTGGSGTLSGVRIARLGGPRVRFVHPPGAKPGAIVTVSGLRLATLAGDGLVFNFTPATPLSANATRIVARVPNGVSSGPVRVTTAGGVALGPQPFNSDVGSPPVVLGDATAPGIAPAAVAISPDGRKLYIADRGNSTVRLIRASSLIDLRSPVSVTGIPRSVAASPDGKRVYVAAALAGVHVMDAASLFVLDTIALASIDDGGRDNPQGLAVSPDGTLLLVSEGADGGSARLYRISDKQLLHSFAFASGLAPLGVAFGPDGTKVYIAVADLSLAAGSLQVFDLDGTQLDSDAVGVLPTALAVTPDGNFVHVTNKSDGTVSVYDAQTGSVGLTPVTVGSGPTGIAISPDGANVYVANRNSNTVSVYQAATGVAVAAPLGVGSQPIGIAVNPGGTAAYVSNVMTTPVVAEIGGTRTLTVARGGTGIGRVRSNPPGIDCGTQCQAQYPAGTSVTLTVFPDFNSFFSGWNGIGCSSTVVLSASRSCVALFTSNTPPPSRSNTGGGGGCFIATAVYGSDRAEDVLALRRFRDETLLTSPAGRAFVRLYYRLSPPIADYIRERSALRAAVRGALQPLVFAVRHPQAAAYASIALLLCLLGWTRRGRAQKK